MRLSRLHKYHSPGTAVPSFHCSVKGRNSHSPGACCSSTDFIPALTTGVSAPDSINSGTCLRGFESKDASEGSDLSYQRSTASKPTDVVSATFQPTTSI